MLQPVLPGHELGGVLVFRDLDPIAVEVEEDGATALGCSPICRPLPVAIVFLIVRPRLGLRLTLAVGCPVRSAFLPVPIVFLIMGTRLALALRGSVRGAFLPVPIVLLVMRTRLALALRCPICGAFLPISVLGCVVRLVGFVGCTCLRWSATVTVLPIAVVFALICRAGGVLCFLEYTLRNLSGRINHRSACSDSLANRPRSSFACFNDFFDGVARILNRFDYLPRSTVNHSLRLYVCKVVPE
jgi:hypothetical protein